MNKKYLILALGVTTLISFGTNALNSKDDCYEAAQELAKGVARSYKVYDKKPAKILKLELTSETEMREYSLDVIHGDGIDSYHIELENDSAFKCWLNHVRPIKINE